MEGRALELLERIADGIEKLASDPEIEIEGGPPICPTCGQLNPEIEMAPSDGGRGKLGEVVVNGTCLHCGSTLYAIIESFSMHRFFETANEEMQQRKAGYDG